MQTVADDHLSWSGVSDSFVIAELNCSKVQERLTLHRLEVFLLVNDLKAHSLSSTESTVISPLAKERLLVLDCLR